ncbi:hypothetical protein LUZ60_010493 [Juncus effusus]|nr:hypothetical protein LUZ60_010493 [Juncus effusus]
MEYRSLFLCFALLSITSMPMIFNLWNKVEKPAPFDPDNVIPLSWKPRIFLYKNFLSPEECDYIVKLAKSRLQKSTVIDNESGKGVKSQVRTSSGMFLNKKEDEVIARIEQRIAKWTFLPAENAENMQVLRYKLTEKYEPHHDYFHDKFNLARGGHRYATVLMYLSDVTKGGETVFPNAEGWESQPKDDSFSDCARKGLAVKPVKGDAVLFYNAHPDGTVDPLSLHASCPVIEGEKWSAPKWIRVGSFDSPRSVLTESEPETEIDVGVIETENFAETSFEKEKFQDTIERGEVQEL